MKKTFIFFMLLSAATTALNAISWKAPVLKTTTDIDESKSFYLYHVGQKQMLTYGGTWGTHAVLDSTGVNALPYTFTMTFNGYTLYSPQAGSMGYLFREHTGTGVYTDFNNNGNSSRYWDFALNNNGTFTITTSASDYIWGQSGTMVTNDEYAYQLGWDPDAQDLDNNGNTMGSNQAVYMLKPNVAGYETQWTLVETTEYDLYQARLRLYNTALIAETIDIDYSPYATAYNGTDISAINAAIDKLKAQIDGTPGEEEDTEMGEAIFVTLTDSSSMIFPKKYIEKQEEDKDALYFTLVGDTIVGIAKSHIVSIDEQFQGELPRFLSYKFNNKFNDQLFTDAIGEIDSINNHITVQVGCIGKRLTPSFQLPEGASAYVNGVRQHSKETRLRFDKPVRYTVAYPRQYVYKVIKTKEAIWSNPETSDEQWLSSKVELTESMLSTNAPTNHGDHLANILDGDHNTIFHSTWGSGAYTPLTWYDGATYGDGTSEWPYVQISLPEPLYRLKFEYTTRNSGTYAPLGLILQGSNDGQTWDDIQSFTVSKDNLPTNNDETYVSPVINLGGSYSQLRLQLTESQRKNYLVFSELAIYKVEENPDYQQEEPTLISPAEYQKGFVPFGCDYTVDVDFLTDHPTSQYNVPRIDITFGDGVSWDNSTWISTKDTYFDATIKIDGAGVFPDMVETPVQIKGRGNSSWSGSPNSKNPYRLKFAEKQKPFGMTKGKSWVLLANKIGNSMTTNAIAMKVADMVQSDGCNHIVPCELYINGHYRGSYNFTEKTGFSNNSIDLVDESYATMLELDSYYDETYKFHDSFYNLPVNVKEPDFSDPENTSLITFADVKQAFNNFTNDVKNSTEYALFDVQSFARALFVNDFVRNEECKHPKSWFIYNADILADSLWHLGPVWDFDWSFGYEGTSTYFVRNAEVDLFSNMGSGNTGYPFFRQLLRGSEKVKKAYFLLWHDFITSGKLDELIEYCDDYFQYVEPSFQHNSTGDDYYLWGDGTQYATITANAKNWLTKRANYIYNNLDKYDLPGEDIDPADDYGQPDRVSLSEVADKPVDVYTIHGILIRSQVPYGEFHKGLMPGIYIVNGKKIAIR